MATKAVTEVEENNVDFSDGDGEEFTIDFTSIKGLEPIDDGKYDVVIRKAEAGRSQQKQPKVDLTYVIEENDAFNGRRIFDTLSFAPGAKWRVKEFMLALGYEEDYKGGVDPREWVGERLVITIAMETSTAINPETGKPYTPRPRVKAFSPAGSNTGLDDIL